MLGHCCHWNILKLFLKTYFLDSQTPNLYRSPFPFTMESFYLSPRLLLFGPVLCRCIFCQIVAHIACRFQELDLSAEALVFSESSRADAWLKALDKALPEGADYTQVFVVPIAGHFSYMHGKECIANSSRLLRDLGNIFL